MLLPTAIALRMGLSVGEMMLRISVLAYGECGTFFRHRYFYIDNGAHGEVVRRLMRGDCTVRIVSVV